MSAPQARRHPWDELERETGTARERLERLAELGILNVIVSGEVDVVGVGVRSVGDVIGEMAVLSDRPRMASLVARTPSRVLAIGRNEFQSILRERPETALALMRVLCERLEESA